MLLCSGNKSYKTPHQYNHESNTRNHVSSGNTWQRKQRFIHVYGVHACKHTTGTHWFMRSRHVRQQNGIQSYILSLQVPYLYYSGLFLPRNWSYPLALLIAIVSDPISWEWSPSRWSLVEKKFKARVHPLLAKQSWTWTEIIFCSCILYAVNISIVVYRILKVYSLSCAKETQRPTPERDSFVGSDMFRIFFGFHHGNAVPAILKPILNPSLCELWLFISCFMIAICIASSSCWIRKANRGVFASHSSLAGNIHTLNGLKPSKKLEA